jgi:FKBP-type peptidyl-prolyl cis-trans isomerase FkpA
MVRITLAVLVLLPVAAFAQKTEDEKNLYAIGYFLGERAAPMGLSKSELKTVQQGFLDAASGAKAKVDPKDRQSQINEFAQKHQQAAAAKTSGPEQKKGKAFADKAAKEPGAQRLPSGVVIRELKPGTGPTPTESDRVKVNYEGKLIDGTVFDSSYKKGKPVDFNLGSVIKCWKEGVAKMKVGEEAQLVCPSDVAYGDHPPPTSGIHPGSTLVFRVELLGIENEKSGPAAGAQPAQQPATPK